jgi:hypothetical protein
MLRASDDRRSRAVGAAAARSKRPRRRARAPPPRGRAPCPRDGRIRANGCRSTRKLFASRASENGAASAAWSHSRHARRQRRLSWVTIQEFWSRPAAFRPESESCYTAAQRHEAHSAARHSITSSATPRSVGGTVMPSASAVLRLMASVNFVGRTTGRSPGFSPLRMRPT